MKNDMKLLLALDQLENVMKLSEGNEWEIFISRHLIPVHCELKRQLTNLTHSSKMKK
jgi:hypothetical protein